MSKDKKTNATNATATNQPAADNAAPAADTKKKAKAGSSVAAQTKTLVVAIATELREHLATLSASLQTDRPLALTDVLTEGTAEWLTKLSGEITSNAQRGLPLVTRLANVEAEITAHWTTLPIVNGAASPTPEWQEKANSLMTKKNNLLRAKKREDSGNSETDADATPDNASAAAK